MPAQEVPAAEGWQRPRPDERRLRIDILIGLVVTATTLLNLTLTRSVGYGYEHPPSLFEQIMWAVLVTLPLCVRRRWPDVIAVVVSVAYIAGQVRHAPEQQLTSGALFAAIYTLGAWGRDHRRAGWVRAGIIVAMFVWLGVAYLIALPGLSAAEFADADGPVSPILAAAINGVLVNVLIFGFAYFFGEVSWIAESRRHQVAAQAGELLAAKEEESARKVLNERLRIARELHDVVAHHVSVMGVQASAGRRVLDRDPDRAKQALAAVEQSARTAVDELHRMLGLLRQSDPPSATGPADTDPAAAPAAMGLNRVAELLDSVRNAGLQTTLGVYGDAVELPESLSMAGYRIVQEAATNTLKHAAATKLDVRIRYHTDELELDVADDGRGRARGSSGGLGLIGMRERVAAHAGTLEAGPRAGGEGFRVRARFPLQRSSSAG